jgi:4-hydroxybenzoate polyprenyltransferase
LGEYIFAIYIFYLILMITYSFILKNLVLIDAITIAIGFVLRVIAGAIVIDAPASSYVVILIISVALLLAFGKRRAEITRLGSTRGISHRKVLSEYPVQLLDSLLSALFATTFFAYILLTFQQELGKTNPILSSYLPSRFNNPHWLKFTIPIVFYGLARYMYLVYVKKEGGAFEELIIKDKALLSTVVVWIIMVIVILYSPIV